MKTTNHYPDRRERALVLLKMGYITQSEAAKQAGVSRQRIAILARKAGIHPKPARDRHIAELMHAARA